MGYNEQQNRGIFKKPKVVYCHDKKSGQFIDNWCYFHIYPEKDILGVTGICEELSHIHVWKNILRA